MHDDEQNFARHPGLDEVLVRARGDGVAVVHVQRFDLVVLGEPPAELDHVVEPSPSVLSSGWLMSLKTHS